MMRMTNYFKVAGGPRSEKCVVRAERAKVDVFPFDATSPVDTARAYDEACVCLDARNATGKGLRASLSVWRPVVGYEMIPRVGHSGACFGPGMVTGATTVSRAA